MTVYIFAGPTIGSTEIANHLEAVVLPPVAMGDVHTIATLQPRAIGIVDGYFDGVPSVWHKEILWAMAQGIPVFGAGSMGALRAAELDAFGMHGIGKIFEAFRDGVIEDDDEVAQHHGPAETGYVSLSEPMVNIRATLERALEQKIIIEDTANELINLAKGEFYPNRNWKELLISGKKNGLLDTQLSAIEGWLPENRLDQKREDAITMFAAISSFISRGSHSDVSKFNFEWTVMWDKAVRSASTAKSPIENPSNIDSWIVDELRLDTERFKQVRRSALLRLLVENPGTHDQVTISQQELRKAITRFRSENGLFMKTHLDDWLAENDLDMEGLERLIEGDLRRAKIDRSSGDALNDHLLAELRLTGAYSEIAARARHKKQLLEEIGCSDSSYRNVGVGALQLRIQFFESRFESPIPDNLENFLQDNGFLGRTKFDRMLAREHIFSQEIKKHHE